MRKKKLLTLGLMAILPLISILALTFNKSQFVNAISPSTYSCNNIVFGEVVGESNETNYTRYLDIESSSVNFEISKFDACSFTKGCHSVIRIGGLYKVGKLTLTLDNIECDKVIVYASGWSGDNASNLKVNGMSNPVTQTIDGDYTFEPYVYNFNRTNEINLETTTASSGRIAVSKIVLRTY